MKEKYMTPSQQEERIVQTFSCIVSSLTKERSIQQDICSSGITTTLCLRAGADGDITIETHSPLFAHKVNLPGQKLLVTFELVDGMPIPTPESGMELIDDPVIGARLVTHEVAERYREAERRNEHYCQELQQKEGWHV